MPHGQRMRNEWRLTIKKRMTLTKEKNNTHKHRILPNDNDERPFKGSNGMKSISTDNSGIRSSYVGLCGTRVTGPWKLVSHHRTSAAQAYVWATCHFLASVEMRFMSVLFPWLDVHHPVMCVVFRPMCYFSLLSTSFVFLALNIIRFSYVDLCGTRVTRMLHDECCMVNGWETNDV